MTVVAIDPGTTESAYVVLDGEKLVEFGKIENQALLERIPFLRIMDEHLAIEMIASQGMPVGAETFETCLWIGRFVQAWITPKHAPYAFVYRRDVKLHVCGSLKAKDGNIRAALIDRWGGKDKAIGRKKSPGPLHGVSEDVWQALAVAVTWADQRKDIAA